MALPWKDVEASKEFQALSPHDQIEAKQEYFNTVVAPNVPPVDVKSAHDEFFSQAVERQKSISDKLINPAMAFGANKAIESGATVKDLPFVAAKIASGATPQFPGALEYLANRPIAGPMQGFDTSKSVFPKPATQGGEQLGNFAGGVAMIPSAIEALQGIMSMTKPVRNIAGFAKEVRQSSADLRTKLGQELESKVTELSNANPTKTIDLGDQMATIKDAIANRETNPGLARDIARTLGKIKDPEIASKIQNLIDNPSEARALSLKDAEDIKRAIGQGTKFGNVTPGDLEMQDLYHEIKLAQAEQFPELSDIRKPYADYMDAYRVIKNKFKEGSLIGNIKKGFGDAEIEARLKTVLPKETIDKIGGVRNAINVINALKKGAKWATIAGLGTAGASFAAKPIINAIEGLGGE